MTLPRITIVGAGLSGLTLGRCLKAKGIPSVILEKSSASPRYNYGITLHRWSYESLLKVLQMDELTFCETLAVDKGQDGMGKICEDHLLSNIEVAPASFRCHRGRLEMLLREGQDIIWDRRIHDVKVTPGRTTVRFQDGTSLESTILIAADGVHSQVRKTLAPKTVPNVLPYVVFNGSRTVSLEDYKIRIAPHMQGSTVIHCRHGSTLFQLSINNIAPPQAVLGYTYSRPARANDALHKPDRPLSGAENIPEDVYAEIEKFGELKPPFGEIFDSEKVRQDRILHWLMRSILLPLDESQDLAKHGVLLIGDAAHAMPILGGEGANIAIRDGFELADELAHEQSALGNEQSHGIWKQAVKKSEKRLADMHGSILASL